MSSNTTITAGFVSPAVVGLSSGSSIAVNAADGNDFRVTLSGDATMGNPSGAVDGQRVTFQITQSSGGSNTVTWGSAYNFGSAGGPPRLSTSGGATDVIGFIYNAAVGAWLCGGSATGF
jgi:hypothetical protein